jgi:hypothetical protein
VIARIWHGWTTLENADLYEALLRDDMFPAIRQIEGSKRRLPVTAQWGKRSRVYDDYAFCIARRRPSLCRRKL